MSTTHNTPALAFVGFSGSGKTTLLEKLIQKLSTQGKRVALIKHAHHEFDIDIPGKDSYRLRHAGASRILVASRKRRALITETPDMTNDPDLTSCLNEIDDAQLDLILVEGFKHANIIKLEINRSETRQPLLYPDDDNIIALISDYQHKPSRNIKVLDLNSPNDIIDFILQYIENNASS